MLMKQRSPLPAQPTFEPTPEALQRFIGYYRAEPGIDVNIERREGSLQLVAHGGASIFPTRPSSP